jgi:hypothetical protein
MPYSFTYTDDPAGIARDAVRLYCGDTVQQGNYSLSDNEIEFLCTSQSGLSGSGGAWQSTITLSAMYRIAAEGCDVIAAKYAREASYAIGGISETANHKALEYRTRAEKLRQKSSRGIGVPWVGGRSLAEKSDLLTDADLVQPTFSRTYNAQTPQ